MVTTRSQSQKKRHYNNSDSDESHCSSLHNDEGNINGNANSQSDNKNSLSNPLNGNGPAEELMGRGYRVSRPQPVSYDMMYMSKALSTRGNVRRREDEDENGELLIHSRYPERAAAKRAVERMSSTMHNLDKEDSAMTNEHIGSDDDDSADLPAKRNGRWGNVNNRTNMTFSQRTVSRLPSFSQRKRDRDSSIDSSITNESLREAEDEERHAERSSSEPLATPTCDVATRREQQQRAKEAVEKNIPINQYLSRAITDGPAEAKRRARSHTENALLGLDAQLPTTAPQSPAEGAPLPGDVTPLRIDSSVTFAQVGGLPGHVVMLREMVLFPLLYPELLQAMNLTPPRGVLFVGPPGTGKTLMARALANEGTHCAQRKVTFFMRKGADILSKWVGESERQLCLLFEEAKRQQPSIIFFDEMDGLAPVRHTKTEQSQAALVSTFLALLDGLDDRGQVIVIGATNRPDTIDPALRRPGRFDRELYFPLPDAAARRHILTIVTRPLLPDSHPQREEILEELTVRSEGWSGAEIQSLCVEAGMNRLRTALPQLYTTSRRLRVPPGALVIQKEDFFLATHRVQSSVRRGAAAAAVNRLDEHLEHLLNSARASILAHVSVIWPNAAVALRRERRDCSDAADAVQELSSFVIPHTTNPLLLFLVPEIALAADAADKAATEFATEKAAIALVKAMPSIRTFAVHLPHLVVDYTSMCAGMNDAGHGMSEGHGAMHGSAGPGEGNCYTSGHIHAVVMAILRVTGPCIVLFHGLDIWLAEFGLLPPGRHNGVRSGNGSSEDLDMDAEERNGRRRQMTVLGYYFSLLRSADVLIVAPTAYTGMTAHIAQFIGGCNSGRIRSVECAVPIAPAEADLVCFTRYIFRVMSLALDHCVPVNMEELPEDNAPPPLPSLEAVRATRRREVDLWRRVDHRRRQLRYVLTKWVSQYLDSRRFSMFLSADLDFASGHELFAAWQQHTRGRRVGLLDVMEKLENEEYTCLSQYHDDMDRLVHNVRSFFRTRSTQDQRYRSRALELKEMTVLNLYKINRNVVRFCEEHRSLTEPDVFSSSSSDSHASGPSANRRRRHEQKQQQQPLIPIISEESQRRKTKRYRYFGQRRRHRPRNRQPIIKTMEDDAPQVSNDEEEADRKGGEEEEEYAREVNVANEQRVVDTERSIEMDAAVHGSENSAIDVSIDAVVQCLKGLTFLQLHRLFQSAMPMLEEEIGNRRRRHQQRQQQQGQTQQTKQEDEQEGIESAHAFFERMIYHSFRESRNAAEKKSTPDRGSLRHARNKLVKLSELFASGILSEDEFKTAKDATIRRYASATQPSQASPPEQSRNERQEQTQSLASSFGVEAYSNGVTSLEDNPRASFLRIDIREFNEDVIGEAQRGRAFKLLETIIQNLQQFPDEPKYRRLRLTQSTLRAQLFAVPGSLCFLRSLGFVPDLSRDFLEIPHPPPHDLLSEAAEAIAFLLQRDAKALARTREHMRLRQSFGLELRRERCARAKAVGELRAHLAQEFCADDAGDGLISSAANLTTLRTILTNAGDPQCRRLRLANPSVHRAVVQQRGGLELLVDGAAAELQDGADGPILALSAAAAAGGLRLVDEITAAVQSAQEERRRADREAAAAAMHAEVRRARQSEEALRRRAEGQVEDEEMGSAAQQRRRIPVAEAVQVLLGKKRHENDAET